MEFFKEYKNIFLGVLIFVIGLIIVINPGVSIQVAVVIIGAISIINGINSIITSHDLIEDDDLRKIVLIKSVVDIAIGLLAVCLPFIFVNVLDVIVKIMLIVEGIEFLAYAAMEIYIISKSKSEGIDYKYDAINIFAAVVLAILMFILSGHLLNFVVRIIGIVTMIGGVLYVVYWWFNKPIYAEAEDIHDVEE